MSYGILIDRAFHFRDKESDKVWRIQVFGSGNTEEIQITYGRVGKELRVMRPLPNPRFATRTSEALDRVSDKKSKGYIRIPLKAFDALQRHAHTSTESFVHSTTQKPTVRAKGQVHRLDVGVLLNADPSKWFF